jgi:hypothetical protein
MIETIGVCDSDNNEQAIIADIRPQECLTHRVESFQEAKRLIAECGDFLFFPKDSLNQNLTEISNLFQDVEVLSMHQYYIGAKKEYDDTYNKELLEHLINYFSHEQSTKIIDSLKTIASHAKKRPIIRHFESTSYLAYHFNQWYNYMFNYNLFNFPKTYEWHFDDNDNDVSVLVPFTKPGTPFCSVDYNSTQWNNMSAEEQTVLKNKCDDATNGITFIPKDDEAVIFIETNAMHKTPFSKTSRAFLRMSI